MNIVAFPVWSTNIFPLANDVKQGGQLMTEYNVRSIDSVGTAEKVKYMIGPSFVHAEEDFKVRIQTDGAGTIISSSTLEIFPGRGVINGHYIESLTPVTIDLLEMNAKAKAEGRPAIKGPLVLGLRAMYSTLPTMAGAMMVDNKDEMYEGIQVVILPKSEFKMPTDVPNQQDKVTAHLKLAEFNFINGAINTVVNNYPQKIKHIDAIRITDFDNLFSDVYIKKTGLNTKKLYVFSGKGTDPKSGKDTWCDATDSLVVWDLNPKLTTTKPGLAQAGFGTTSKGYTQLVVPHKQVDGMLDTSGKTQYYANRVIDLPLADYSKGTAGTVDKKYTNRIKEISQKLHDIYRLPNGKQVGYIQILDVIEDLPSINSNWKIGDYIIVGQDNTLDETIDGIRPPSTMYVLLPGIVTEYTYHSAVKNSAKVPAALTGIELARDSRDVANGEEVNINDPDVYREYFDLTVNYRGSVNTDYFMIALTSGKDVTRYYYTVSQSGERGYSNPVYVTGEIPLAQEDTIGGFYNVPETQLDNGYVFRDENGNLRLLDYGLLRSGTLAYQLGEDFEAPAGITAEELQVHLDDYINQRVAFPNFEHTQNADNPNVIEVTIDISDEEDETEINIYDIDCRFNTSVFLHINGKATEKCTINISDCQRIRIDGNIGGTPTINLYRSCLYYDPNIIDTLNIIKDMSLWYERYEETDANLLVDNMTVRECDAPIVPEDIEFWNPTTPNDNHYMYALQSITFGPDGSIIGCGLFVKNETSANISEGHYVITSTFEIPQGAGLAYPRTKMKKPIKITGSFINAYATSSPVGYMVMDTNFSALSQAYDEYDTSNVVKGSIAFYVNAVHVTNITGMPAGTSIDAWESNAFHCFQGTVL